MKYKLAILQTKHTKLKRLVQIAFQCTGPTDGNREPEDLEMEITDRMVTARIELSNQNDDNQLRFSSGAEGIFTMYDLLYSSNTLTIFSINFMFISLVICLYMLPHSREYICIDYE